MVSRDAFVSKMSEGYMKVGALKPDFMNVNVVVKVLSVGLPRVIFSRRNRSEHRVAEAFVGDETGSVLLTLWGDQIGRFKAGDILEIRNGYTSLLKGSLRLNAGGRGMVEKVDKEIGEVNTKNNLSEQIHIKTPWSEPGGKPFKKQKRRY